METVKIVPINTITYMFMMIIMSLRAMITNPWQLVSQAIQGNYLKNFMYDEQSNRLYPFVPMGFLFSNRRREIMNYQLDYLRKRSII